MRDLQTVFITHLHSDHTLGLPDLIFTPWVLGRTHPLAAYGPRGLRDMTTHILAAWSKDIQVRTEGLEHLNRSGFEVDVHEIGVGTVYKDNNVTVTAFLVRHATWDQAFGYRFHTVDRSFVISGDTAPSASVVTACAGCDVLLHEIYVPAAPTPGNPAQAYFSSAHTSPEELAALATKAKPKLLVLYHQVFHGATESDLLARIRRHYAGPVVSAHDLDIY
jgi:ribonuclease BN (tRNA processing enzyme)